MPHILPERMLSPSGHGADRGYEQSARFYDLFAQETSIPFFVEIGKQHDRVLDVGAGTGRIALPLARMGVEVTCVEPSPAMRAELSRKLGREDGLIQRVQVLASEAATFFAGRQYRLALVSGAFDHFEGEAGRLAALRNIASHLLPHGELALDVCLGGMVDQPVKLVDEVQWNGETYRRHVGSTVQADGSVVVQLIYEAWKGERLLEQVMQQSLAYIVTRSEVHDALAQSGFTVQAEYGGYDGQPFVVGGKLLVIKARLR